MNFRNISRLLAVFAVMLFVATPLLTAQDSDDDAVAAAFQKIVKLGPGVHFVKTNEEGEIVSLVAVGSKTITTVFGAARGRTSFIYDARDRPGHFLDILKPFKTFSGHFWDICARLGFPAVGWDIFRTFSGHFYPSDGKSAGSHFLGI